MAVHSSGCYPRCLVFALGLADTLPCVQAPACGTPGVRLFTHDTLAQGV